MLCCLNGHPRQRSFRNENCHQKSVKTTKNMRPSVCDVHAVPSPCIKKGDDGGPRREQMCEGHRAIFHITRGKQASLVKKS